MSDVTLPATGQKVATELDTDGANVQVVAALIERSAMLFAAQLLQNIVPFPEAGVLVRPSGTFTVSGGVTVSATPPPATFGFSASLGMSESDLWHQSIRSNIA